MPQYAQPSILLWLIAKKSNEHEFKSGNYVNLFTHDFKTVDKKYNVITSSQRMRMIDSSSNDTEGDILTNIWCVFLCSASRRRWHNAGWSIVFDGGPTYNQHWVNISWLLPLSHSSIVVVFFIRYYQTRNSGWKSAQHQPEVPKRRSVTAPWLSHGLWFLSVYIRHLFCQN